MLILLVMTTAMTITQVPSSSQAMSCEGEGVSVNLQTGEQSETSTETGKLTLRREENKVYLSFNEGAFIEASVDGDTLAYVEVPNMIGTRSLSFNETTGAVDYQAVSTRHGKSMANYSFKGLCHIAPAGH